MMNRLLLLVIGLLIPSIAIAEAPVRWKRHAVELPEPMFGVEAIDGDGDGRQELFAVGPHSVWSIDALSLVATRIATTLGGKTIHCVALDMDGDGDRDLALGRSASDWIQYRQTATAEKPQTPPVGEDWTVAWLENPAAASAPLKTDRWRLHVLDQELHGVHGVTVGDVDRDGRLDLLADSFAGPHFESSLAWFRGGTEAPAPRRLITHGQATGRPHYMDFADMDQDGRGDVLLGASTEGSFTWWRQPTDLDAGWQRQEIAWEPGATHPRAVDVNGDGRLDVIGSTGHGTGIFWYRAPQWQKQVIDPALPDVHAFDVGDLDGDGDIDAVGCSFSQKMVRWWEQQRDGRFVAHDIDTQHQQEAYDLKVIDFDGDGDADVLLAGRQSRNVVWYENLATTKPTPQ